MLTMIFDPAIISLFCGFFVLGAAVNYVIWSRVRQIFLRQELFAVRDSLWDLAREKGFMDDPRYRATRSMINSCIKGASFVNINNLALGRTVSKTELPHATSEFVKNQCDTAITKCARILFVHAVVYRASGWVFVANLLLRGLYRHIKSQSMDHAKAWIRSTAPERAYQLDHRRLAAR